MENVFLLLGLALVASTITAWFFKQLRQPSVLAYILTGFLLGPGVLGLFSQAETTRVLSEMGITFLLFTVGLSMSVKNLKELAKVSLVTGVVQVLLIGAAGFFLAVRFGFSSVEAFYIGLALAFSSTIIVVKLLIEKKELNSLHGRISVGFLLVQDFLAIIALVLLPVLSVESSNPSLEVAILLWKTFAFLVVVGFVTKYFLKEVFDSFAKNPELLFLSSISYCFLLAVTSYYLGLSPESGAFLAGISLGTLPYNLDIVSKVKPLRDFFIVIFFLTLGAGTGLSLNPSSLAQMLEFSVIVLVATPLLIMALMGLLGYRKRTSFLTGIAVAQISEFSLILVAMGENAGHLSSETVSMITGVGVLTITVSAYFILYGHKLYQKLSPLLTVFEKKNASKEPWQVPVKLEKHVVVVGYHRVGYGIVKKLLEMKENVVVVDFDPEVIKQLTSERIPCVYGDISDPEIASLINLEDARIVISTAPDVNDNLRLLREAKKLNKDVVTFVVAEQVEEALQLYDAGADYVILPHLLGSHHASLLLEEITNNFEKLIETKVKHLEELHQRRKLHPHHNRN